MIRWDGKEPINTLLSIDTIFGDHQSSMIPILLLIASGGVPLLVWVLVLMPFIPFKWFVGPWIIFTARMAMITVGKEKKIIAAYLEQRNDVYKQATDIVHTNNIYDDGLIEYSNGTVGYILTGFPKGYLSDKKFSVDFEDFLNELDQWSVDYYLHNSLDELLCEDLLPNLTCYKDDQVIQDRIDFYAYQDEYSRSNSGLYRYSFLVTCGKADWKRMKQHLNEVVSSQLAQCFNELTLCTKADMNDLINRDLCSYIDLIKMITQKYENADYGKAQVLWYDDKVPKKFKEKKPKVDMKKRRTSE